MSIQLDHYLQLRAAGLAPAAAALKAGIPAGEIVLHEAAIARGEIALPSSNSEFTSSAGETSPGWTGNVRGAASCDQAALDAAPHRIPEAGNASIEKEKVNMARPKHDPVNDVPEAEDPLVELAADTLRGDIRDSLLAWFKAAPKAWPYMSKREQRDLAEAADRYSGTLIKQACHIIAAGERPTIVAKLVEYREKDGVEAKLKLASTGEVVAQLHEACGRDVLLVATGFEEFDGEAAGAKIDADAPKFPDIGEEYQAA